MSDTVSVTPVPLNDATTIDADGSDNTGKPASVQRQCSSVPSATVGWVGATANIVTTNIGSGVLILPSAIKDAGYILSAIMIPFTGFVAAWLCNLTVETMNMAEDYVREQIESREVASFAGSPKKAISNNSCVSDAVLSEGAAAIEDADTTAEQNNIAASIQTAQTQGSMRVRMRTIVDIDDVAKVAYGKWGYYMSRGTLVVTVYFVMISFIVLLGDELQDYYNFIPGNESSSCAIWKVLISFVLFGLSSLKDMANLSKISLVGVISIAILIIALVGCCIAYIVQNGTYKNTYDIGGDGSSLELLGACALFVYSYGAVLVVPSLVETMRDPKEIKKAITISHIFVTVTYCLIGFMGYVAFGAKTGDNILSTLYTNFGWEWWVASLSLVIDIVVTYPIIAWVLMRMAEARIGVTHHWQALLLRFFLIFSACGIACTPIAYFKDLVGLVPAVTLVMISFIWPMMFYWGVKSKINRSWSKTIAAEPWKFALHTVLLLWSCVMMVTSFITSLLSLIDHIQSGEQPH